MAKRHVIDYFNKVADQYHSMLIEIKDFEEDGCSKLKIHQMFSADIMRINTEKKVYQLQTDYDYVKEKIKELTNLT